MCDRRAWTQRFLAVLNDVLGWTATESEDGDIFFGNDGSGFGIVNYAPEDPEYLVVQTGVPLETYENGSAAFPDRATTLSLVARAANRVNVMQKGVKITVDEDHLVFAVEMVAAAPHCLPAPAHLAAVLPRARGMLVAAVVRFREEIALVGIAAVSADASADADERSELS